MPSKQHFARSIHPENVVNHVAAIKASYEDHAKAVPFINTPTLIIHGRKDPIFPIDHGEYLHKSISGSQLIIKEDMGHLIPPQAGESFSLTLKLEGCLFPPNLPLEMEPWAFGKPWKKPGPMYVIKDAGSIRPRTF